MLFFKGNKEILLERNYLQNYSKTYWFKTIGRFGGIFIDNETGEIEIIPDGFCFESIFKKELQYLEKFIERK